MIRMEENIREHTHRMLMLSMNLFCVSHLEQASTEGGKACISVTAAALDSFVETVRSLPAPPLSPKKEERRTASLEKTLNEMQQLIGQMADQLKPENHP